MRKKRLGLVLSLVLIAGFILMSAAPGTMLAASASSGRFVIHKVDGDGNPLAGAGFEVYGKPVLTTVTPEPNPTPEPTPAPTETPRTEITVTKVWEDGSDAAGQRPDADAFAGSLHLLANGEEAADASPEITEKDADTWTVTWRDLPARDADGEIVYTVREDAVDGYASSGAPAENGGTIRNFIPTALEYYKLWDIYNQSYDTMLISAADFAPYVELWSTTDPDFDPSHPENLDESAYEKVEDAPLAVVTETERRSVENYDATGWKITYTIRFENLPLLADDGSVIRYLMRENHVQGLDLFGGPGRGALAYGFCPAEDFNRQLTDAECRQLGIPEAEWGDYRYYDVYPMIATRTFHALYGVAEGGTITNAIARILDGWHLIS